MHMWHHVTNHLIVSNDKDSNSEMNENYADMTLLRNTEGLYTTMLQLLTNTMSHVC
jgi:hypothetical protein